MARLIEYALLGTFSIALIIFAIRFFRSDWRVNIVGRYFMYFWITLVILFVYMMIGGFLGDYPGRVIVEVLLLISLNYGAWKMISVLSIIQNGDPVKPKIFGREPTLYIALITALISWGVGFGWEGLTAENAAWISAVINAVAAAAASFLTRPIAPQLFTYGMTTIFGLLASYGLSFSQEMVSSTQFVLLTLLALVTRGEVSPVDDAHKTGVMGNKDDRLE
jgi:hypothetical protein